MTTIPSSLPSPIPGYQLEASIGEGNAGKVWLASKTDGTSSTQYAIKIYHEQADDTVFLRCMREAEILGSLDNEHIVKTYESSFEHAKNSYLVMEFIPGHTLDRYIKRNPNLSMQDRLDIMSQLLTGIESIHAANIIHRDIKPKNIMISHEGKVKIMDFGIARTSSSSLTFHGFHPGTPQYMSPEQTLGTSIDFRSDLFSAGLVFYYILVGENLLTLKGASRIDSADYARISSRIYHADKIITPFAIVLKRALAMHPNERYPSVSEFKAALALARKQSMQWEGLEGKQDIFQKIMSRLAAWVAHKSIKGIEIIKIFSSSSGVELKRSSCDRLPDHHESLPEPLEIDDPHAILTSHEVHNFIHGKTSCLSYTAMRNSRYKTKVHALIDAGDRESNTLWKISVNGLLFSKQSESAILQQKGTITTDHHGWLHVFGGGFMPSTTNPEGISARYDQSLDAGALREMHEETYYRYALFIPDHAMRIILKEFVTDYNYIHYCVFPIFSVACNKLNVISEPEGPSVEIKAHDLLEAAESGFCQDKNMVEACRVNIKAFFLCLEAGLIESPGQDWMAVMEEEYPTDHTPAPLPGAGSFPDSGPRSPGRRC